MEDQLKNKLLGQQHEWDKETLWKDIEKQLPKKERKPAIWLILLLLLVVKCGSWSFLNLSNPKNSTVTATVAESKSKEHVIDKPSTTNSSIETVDEVGNNNTAKVINSSLYPVNIDTVIRKSSSKNINTSIAKVSPIDHTPEVLNQDIEIVAIKNDKSKINSTGILPIQPIQPLENKNVSILLSSPIETKVKRFSLEIYQGISKP